jgi:hypothetical protein
MRVLVLFGGYLLIPFLVALFFRLLKIKWVFISYLITSLLIYFFIDFQLEMLYYFAPPAETMPPQRQVCGTGAYMMWVGSLVCFLPATLMIQLLFNYLLTNAFFIKKAEPSSQV